MPVTGGKYKYNLIDESVANPTPPLNDNFERVDDDLTAQDARITAVESGLGDNGLADYALKVEVQAEKTARQNADALLAPKESPTFTGTVTIPDPVNPTDAVNKRSVETSIATATPDLSGYAKTDGSRDITGNIKQTAEVPTDPAHITRKDYVDSTVLAAAPDLAPYTKTDGTRDFTGNIKQTVVVPTDPAHITRKDYVDSAILAASPDLNPYTKTDGTRDFTGNIKQTEAAPTDPAHLVRKSYVDALDAGNIKLDGSRAATSPLAAPNFRYGFNKLADASAISLDFDLYGSAKLVLTNDVTITGIHPPDITDTFVKHMSVTIVAGEALRTITLPGTWYCLFQTIPSGGMQTFTIAANKRGKLSIEADPDGDIHAAWAPTP